MNKNNNYAFIDGQNLHLGTTSVGWKVDLIKFREYLKKKFNVSEAYYFLGVVDSLENDLYVRLQKAGFILVFRKHNTEILGKKKGNVDVDLVFEVMKKLYKKEIDGSVVLVTGDGDYIKMIDFLIEENKFEKILLPNFKKSSSLYKKLRNQFFVDLSYKDVRKKIEYKK